MAIAFPNLVAEEQSPLAPLLGQQQRREQEAAERLQMLAYEHIYLLGEMASTVKQDQKELKRENLLLQEQVATLSVTLESARGAYHVKIIPKIEGIYRECQLYFDFIEQRPKLKYPLECRSFEDGIQAGRDQAFFYASHPSVRSILSPFYILYNDRLTLIARVTNEVLANPNADQMESFSNHSQQQLVSAPGVMQHSSPESFIQQRELEIKHMQSQNVALKIDNERLRHKIRRLHETDEKIKTAYKSGVHLSLSSIFQYTRDVLKNNEGYTSVSGREGEIREKTYFGGFIYGFEEAGNEIKSLIKKINDLAMTLQTTI